MEVSFFAFVNTQKDVARCRRVSDIFTGVIDYRVYGESFASPALGSIRLFKFDNRVTEARTIRELTPRSAAILFPYFCIKRSFCN